MNIGIDIDGVLTNYERARMDYATKLCVEKNWPITVNENEYKEQKTFNWTEEQLNEFWYKFLFSYVVDGESRLFAQEIIEKLKKEGNKIILITARDEEGLTPEHYGEMQQLTRKWLEKQNIKYDKLIFTINEEKLEKCLENNIDLMIEDCPSNIAEISKKIKVIKFDCQYNKHVTGDNIITGYSWYHIYRIVNEEKEKKVEK